MPARNVPTQELAYTIVHTRCRAYRGKRTILLNLPLPSPPSLVGGAPYVARIHACELGRLGGKKDGSEREEGTQDRAEGSAEDEAEERGRRDRGGEK